MYVSLEQLKRTLELQGETFADPDLTLAIESASAVVESICGRHFTVPFGADAASGDDAPDTTRTFTPTRDEWVPIDDLVKLTSVEYKVGSGEWTAWAEADYTLEPSNAEADGVPWTVLRLADGCFEPGTSVRVTGKFGWYAVPAPVVKATSILSARLLKRAREAPFGIAGMGADGVAVRVSRSDPDVSMLLGPYTVTQRLA